MSKPDQYEVDFIEDISISEQELIQIRKEPHSIKYNRQRTLEGIEYSFQTLEIEESTKDLIRSIINNDSELRILDLTDIKFLSLTPSDTRQRFGALLCKALEFNDKLERINLGNHKFGPDVGMEIINALDLKNNNTLTNLNILGIGINKDNSEEIFNCLRNNKSLIGFKYDKTPFNSWQNDLILDALLANGRIEEEAILEDDMPDSTKSNTSSISNSQESNSPSSSPSSKNLVAVKESSRCCVIS